MHDVTFKGRKITFPIVLDDIWTREALQRYMRTIRNEAVYLPSNIEYLAANNGLPGGAGEALKLLTRTDWVSVRLRQTCGSFRLSRLSVACFWRGLLPWVSLPCTCESDIHLHSIVVDFRKD